MKNIILSLVAIFFIHIAFAQNLQTIMDEGVSLHDQGKYEEAIEKFKEALKIVPNSTWVHYEIANSYFYNGEYKTAIKHADLVIKQKDKNLALAYLAKGNSLDMLGEQKKAIKVFKKAIRKTEGHYLLNYNLGLTYYKNKQKDKAEDALIEGIAIYPGHSSTHLLLGYLQYEKSDKVPTILALQLFLFLEPDSKRAKDAYEVMMKEIYGNITEGEENSVTISLTSDLKSEFSVSEMLLGLKGAQKHTEEYEEMSNEDFFVEHMESFYSILGETESKNFWRSFYASFYYGLSKSEHLKAYCMYISQIGSEVALKWVDENEDKIENMLEWVKDNFPTHKG